MTNTIPRNTEEQIQNSLGVQDFLKRLEELYGITNSFPWQVISRRQLAKTIGVHLQTMANWDIRDKGPTPSPRGIWRQNKAYYPIANIQSWLGRKPIWHVYKEWLEGFYIDKVVNTKEECQSLIEELVKSRAFEQPQWRMKARYQEPNFKFETGVTT